MERRAARNGFEALTAVLKLAYLKEWEVEFESVTRKREAEDDARAQWIAAKRWRAHYPGSARSEGEVPSKITPDSQDCFDEDAENESARKSNLSIEKHVVLFANSRHTM